MNFFVRFFVGYVLVAALAVLLAMKLFTDQLVPGVRQSVEESLVQTANLLAEIASQEAVGSQGGSGIAAVFRAYESRRFEARIYGVLKTDPDLRVYVTDKTGRVLFDSRGRDVGKDYSRWLDVGRTLRGQYGARTTRETADEGSSVMYVAAPILRNGAIAGVLSVGKPARSFQGFIDLTRTKAWESALWLFALALLLALGFSYWMTRDLRRLVQHANEVATGRRDRIPIEGRSELRRLAQALEHLRAQLDGKAHVEKVSQLLAHEVKSPIAAVRGAVELLSDEDDPHRRRGLEANIAAEARRLQRIVEGVLDLARAENRGRLDDREEVALDDLLREVLATRADRLAAKHLKSQTSLVRVRVSGSRFLLRQAVGNLIDNAADFSPPGGTLTVALDADADQARLCIADQGPGIPDYAMPRLFERFYSVPRPESGERSSGLGLNLVQEVARLHQGAIALRNRSEGGAEACLRLPLAKDT